MNEFQGINSRLDEIQAAFLSVKLKYIDLENDRRREIALKYLQQIKNDEIVLPAIDGTSAANSLHHVWHLFVVRISKRDEVQAILKEKGIQTLIHYPIPPHKQQAYKVYNNESFPLTERIHNEVLSLPISPVMPDEAVVYVSNIVNKL